VPIPGASSVTTILSALPAGAQDSAFVFAGFLPAEGGERQQAVAALAAVPRAVVLLVESASRPALQAFLAAWHPVLQQLRVKGLIRWAVDVDPLAI
jgi:16S rRNA C1402 (ribose-2'-O) methylase RsmI